MNKLRLVILKNERDRDILSWLLACEKFENQIHCSTVDLTGVDWLERILHEKPDLLLTKPSGLTASMKQLYDERLTILVRELGIPCFPSLQETLIYENKRYLSYWLKAHHIPHPKTDIFYRKDKAEEYIKNAKFPIVAKLNIGAAGNGVEFLDNYAQADEYIRGIFLSGKTSRTGPKLSKGHLMQRVWRKLTHPTELKERLQTYKAVANDVQRGFCIFQEYIPHAFEWRVVRIGDSFFAHKKLKKGEKTSGSLLKEYVNPPFSLLDFVKELTEKFSFYSQAIDIFAPSSGPYLVNEMQCIFGQSDPYQMLVDGVPGRYVNFENKWIFEAGDFASNQCYDLRLAYIIEQFGNRQP